MSLTAMYGFDSFDAASWNGVANPTWPKIGAGILGTPYEEDLLITLTTNNEASTRYNTVGVTGQEAHKIGVGAERRNLLMVCRDGVTSTSYNSVVRINAPRNITAANSYRRVTGFSFVDMSPAEPAVAYNLINHRRGASVSGIITRRAGNIWSLGSVQATIERNRVYYIEIVEYMTGVSSGSGTVMMEIWIDGELAAPAWGYTTLGFGSVYAASVEVSTAPGLSQMCLFGLADIYVTDELGEAPMNSRLGPQIVLPLRANAVRAADWTVVGAADAKTALTDGLDSTSIRSPLTKSSFEADFDLSLAPGSVVNGIAVFERGKRDAGAPRTISAKINRTADQVQLAAGSTVTLTPGYSGKVGARTPLANAADRAQLVFPDSGKVTCVFTSE